MGHHYRVIIGDGGFPLTHATRLSAISRWSSPKIWERVNYSWVYDGRMWDEGIKTTRASVVRWLGKGAVNLYPLLPRFANIVSRFLPILTPL